MTKSVCIEFCVLVHVRTGGKSDDPLSQNAIASLMEMMSGRMYMIDDNRLRCCCCGWSLLSSPSAMLLPGDWLFP